MRVPNFISISVWVVSCVGCAETPRAASVSNTPSNRAQNPPSITQREPDARIAVADDILKACGLSQSDAYFEYNSAALRTREAGIVVQLAQCFSTGALAGRGMKLVGHADPRGDEEFNYALAGRRADSVRQAFADRHLDPRQISTSSRGELDANGADESGWSKDRRVDVLLAN